MFDAKLVAINDALGRMSGDAATVTDEAIDPTVRAALIAALAHAYHTAWPSKPILIDVSGDAGPVGAYTTDSGPAGFAGHATISPR